MKLEIIQGDITKLELDAIVNAANSSLMGGGGVDGAIHQAAGPQLVEECRRIRQTQYPDGLPTGQAVITGGYRLPAKHVIHTVGPVYDEDPNHAALLADAYRNSLRVAEENRLRSIAFPAISTGIFGYPKDEALQVVKSVMDAFPFQNVDQVVLCYFSAGDKALAERFFGR
ncbi:MAG TPA: O-acetyl-ADP-ribose deacetylase [Candidatus Nanoarchaeia archaeon]|nr:O-acetyl-ADP-ribose deacetylase [Candidatus Nanoarchaeia archaeon]